MALELASLTGLTSTAAVARPAAARPVQPARPLQAPAEHDPKLCEHCLGGAQHDFSPGGDEVLVSREARDGQAQPDAAAATRPQGASTPRGADGEPLTEEELDVVRQLAARDREVRAHEQAHVAAAGPYATGGPSYTYQTGPDGQRYAIGGEVGIDTSPVPGNPEATLRKARTILAAANAPAEPSAQDRAVAAAAASMMAQAQAELARTTAVAQYTRGETVPGASIDIAA